jgi:hypothetical protein
MIEQNHPFITCLLHYQAANNAHDVTTAVAAFTENGIIEINGQISQGSQALYAAHEYDRGSDTQIKMADFEIEENTILCAFITENEFDRVLGTGGIRGRAVFTFEDNRIAKFHLMPPDEAEHQRIRGFLSPAMAWIREHHADKLAEGRSFDYKGGRVLYELAHLYAQRDANEAIPGNKSYK